MERKLKAAKHVTSINSSPALHWISEYAVINHFHICKKTLVAWHRKEGLPRYQIGRVIMYKESDINLLIEKHVRKGTNKSPGNNTLHAK